MRAGGRPLEASRLETVEGEARQVLRSPEQVALHLPIAGPGNRILAYAVDAVVIVLLEIGLLVLALTTTTIFEKLAGPLQKIAEELSHADSARQFEGNIILGIIGVLVIVQFLVEWGYFTFWEMITAGRSLGKMLIGLRVVKDDGFPVTFQQSLVRNLLRMVDMLPTNYITGLVAMVVSKQGKRLGDQVAGTIVIRLDRPEAAAPSTPSEHGVSTSFRFDRAQIAQIGKNERALLRQTLRRVEVLPPEKGEEVLGLAVEALRKKMGYGPVEASERKDFLRALLTALKRS
jgi:uncharacterized RDD family membrane protein YckC